MIDSHERLTHKQADAQRRHGKYQQLRKLGDIYIAVQAADAFAHCVDSVGEGEEQIYLLVHLRQQLYREGAAGACDLENHDDDDYRLADVAEGQRERIDYRKEHEARDRRGHPQQHRLLTLAAEQVDVTEHDDRRLRLPHEQDILETVPRDGIVLCPGDMARDISAALGMEVSPCHSISAAIEALLEGKGDFAGLIVDSYYDTEWLYSMIYRQPIYINSFIPLPDGRMLALFSKHLYSDVTNSIVSVAFSIRMEQYGDLSQTLAVFAEAKLNVEYFRVKTVDIDQDDSQRINIVFAELSGSLTSADSRAAFLQLQQELQVFRVIGYRESY